MWFEGGQVKKQSWRWFKGGGDIRPALADGLLRGSIGHRQRASDWCKGGPLPSAWGGASMGRGHQFCWCYYLLAGVGSLAFGWPVRAANGAKKAVPFSLPTAHLSQGGQCAQSNCNCPPKQLPTLTLKARSSGLTDPPTAKNVPSKKLNGIVPPIDKRHPTSFFGVEIY